MGLAYLVSGIPVNRPPISGPQVRTLAAAGRGIIPGTNIPFTEQFSTHIENMLRAEHLLPLRAFYGVDASGAGTYPLINGAGQSLYYNNYDYNQMNGLRAAPIRLIVPANTLSPATLTLPKRIP